MIVVLLGPHGVGKTTLGRALSARLGWCFDEEIGRRLAADVRWRPQGRRTDEPQEEFDGEVFRLELERDQQRGPDSPRVVETWHPGNLAYAATRSPRVVRRYLEPVRHQVAARRAFVVHLTAQRATLARRQSFEGTIEYFERVGRASARWARRLGLVHGTTLSTDDLDPDALAARVIERLATWRRQPCE
ncbi:MAG: AAA family ATPase [Myxococcota bacterium]|nr:AAA family ATPase [Myxococcota bacterium]MDW8362816.1 AAA family ATPase [Myxococcales bacterium]